MSYFVQKGSQVYIFHGLSSKEKYSGYQSSFQSSITSFDNLTDTQKLNKKPKRLKLRTVARTGSLKNTLTDFGIKQDELESIALLNGLKLDDSVSKGSLIKTVVE